MKYQVRHSLYAIAKNESGLYEFDAEREPVQFELDNIPSALSQFEKWSIGEYGYDYLVENMQELQIEPYVAPIEIDLDAIIYPMSEFLDDLDDLKESILKDYHWYRWDYETLVEQVAVNIDLEIDVPHEYDDEDEQYEYYRDHRDELHEVMGLITGDRYICFNFGQNDIHETLRDYVSYLFEKYGKDNSIPENTPIKLV